MSSSHSLQRIRKAVFPVAGMGTRFLPATKASPKEMLPIVDKPLIQYALEEAVEAGIEVAIFITGRNKRSIPDHFDKAYELEAELEARGKHDLLEMVRNIVPEHVTPVYIRQAEALGLGHAVLCAQPVIGNEPFAVILADDLIKNTQRNALAQMINAYQHYPSNILAVEKVPMEQISRYGVVEIDPLTDRVGKVRSMVEKPSPEKAPSDLGVVGRYILTPDIFNAIRESSSGAQGEIQLTDAIDQLGRQQPVYSLQVEGRRYDCGSKIGYLEATVEYALEHEELGEDFRAFLQQAAASGLF